MRRVLPGLLLSIALFAGDVLAHGGGHRRPPPEPPHPGVVPPGTRRPGVPYRPSTPGGPNPPPPPTTPGGQPQKGPTTPTPGPADPTGRPQRRQPANPRLGTVSSQPTSWRVWWEYNREYLLGLRQMIRESGRGTVTGKAADRKVDPMAGHRRDVRAALRKLIENPNTHHKLKQACLIAYGRVGIEADTEVFLAALTAKKAHEDTQSAALLGLGLLPALKSATLRDSVHEHLVFGIGAGKDVKRRVRDFGHLAAGLRARYDKRLAMTLASQCTKLAWDSQDAAVRLYSCGVTRDAMLLAEVMLAARNDTHGGKRLHDLGRSHAVAALGLIQSPVSFDLIVKLLRSRKAGIQTRRAAALSIGRMLREANLSDGQIDKARKDLLKTLDKGSDSILRAYSAIALAGAKRPMAIRQLMEVIDHGGNYELKTYAALALGLACRNLEEVEVRRVRRFLVEELGKAKDIELQSALSLACGMGGATAALEELQKRVAKKSLPAQVRGSAAEALGLLRVQPKECGDLLMAALEKGPQQLVEGAALGLGLLGRRGVAPMLVKRLANESSGIVQGALTMALGHLGQSGAVEPLLKTLNDKNEKRVVRELAAVALGMLGDENERDILFDLDAYFNYFATTPLTHELLTIF